MWWTMWVGVWRRHFITIIWSTVISSCPVLRMSIAIAIIIAVARIATMGRVWLVWVRRRFISTVITGGIPTAWRPIGVSLAVLSDAFVNHWHNRGRLRILAVVRWPTAMSSTISAIRMVVLIVVRRGLMIIVSSIVLVFLKAS